MKTISTRPQDAEREWFVVDADGKTLGRLSSEIAARLRTTTHMVKKHLSRAMAECREALDDGE